MKKNSGLFLFSILLFFSCSKDIAVTNEPLEILDFDQNNPTLFSNEKMGPYAADFITTGGYHAINFSQVCNAGSKSARFYGYVSSSLNKETQDQFLIDGEKSKELNTEVSGFVNPSL